MDLSSNASRLLPTVAGTAALAAASFFGCAPPAQPPSTPTVKRFDLYGTVVGEGYSKGAYWVHVMDDTEIAAERPSHKYTFRFTDLPDWDDSMDRILNVGDRVSVTLDDTFRRVYGTILVDRDAFSSVYKPEPASSQDWP